MSQQPQEAPRPSDATIIAVQKSEIDRMADNRVMLVAQINEMQQEAQAEFGRLHGVISFALGMLGESDQAKVTAMLKGEPIPDDEDAPDDEDPGEHARRTEA